MSGYMLQPRTKYGAGKNGCVVLTGDEWVFVGGKKYVWRIISITDIFYNQMFLG